MYSARQIARMVSLLIATSICRADAGGRESFLDAQTIIDTWQSNYARIDSYKVRVSKRVITGADPCELTYSCVDMIEDRGRFHLWMTNSALGFDEKEKVIISSFNGHQSKDFRGAIQEARIVSGSLHPQGVAFVNPLLSVLGSERVMIADPSVTTMSPLRRSLKEEFPEGIPGITYDYRVAKEKGRVVVRPELEVVAGVSCHVVDVEGFSPQVSGTTWWFAQERSMLRVKSSHRYRDGETNSMEVLELAKVDTETGALWYPRKAIRQQKREGRDRLVEIEVAEFVPHIKVPDSTFDVTFPPGTRVRDSIAGMIYHVGQEPKVDPPVIEESPSPESPEPVGLKRGSIRSVSLETLRQKVLANEAKASLLRMEYRCFTTAQGDDPQISESALDQGEHGNYGQHVYAQDGKRFHWTASTYQEQKCVDARIDVVNGEVRKSVRLPDLMEGWITRVDKFTWVGVEPIRMVFRPYANRLLMSDCLVPEHASVCQCRVTIEGRDAALVEVKDPQKGPYYMLTWLDLERGLPLRTEHYFPNKDGTGHRCSMVAEPRKFHRLPNGGWMAVEGVMRMHRIREGFTMDLDVFCTVDVNSISIEKKDIPDSLFDIQFPPGARIQNHLGRK